MDRFEDPKKLTISRLCKRWSYDLLIYYLSLLKPRGGDIKIKQMIFPSFYKLIEFSSAFCRKSRFKHLFTKQMINAQRFK